MSKFAIREGKLPSITAMRRLFEKAIRDTPQFRDSTPLGIMEVNGVFHAYMDPDTDTMWLGFAIGLRMAQRFADGGLLIEQEGAR